MRWRITVIASLAAFVVLTLAGIAVVIGVQRQLRADLDHSLEQRADQIEAAALGDPPGALANSNQEDRFAQILDSEGRVIAATDNVAGRPALATPPAGRQSASTRTDIPIEDDSYRVLIRRFDTAAGPQWVIVGENVDDVQDGIRSLVAALVVVLPLTVGALAGTVWWLVGRTLQPVEAIRREVAEIGLTEIDHRVPRPGTGDEIDRLALTMNEMLGRIDAAVSSQRGFVADASHELRTPLTRLRTALEVDLGRPDADLRRTCRDALADTVEMQALVDDLLFLARRDADVAADRRGRRAPVDLDVIVDSEARALRESATVELDLSGVGAAATRGDASQLTRLVRNVLSNAVEHATSRVTVTLVDGEHVELAIEDDGPGVPADQRDRIFERFVRLDTSRTSAGAGLGLAIASDIALDHGGSIRVTDAMGSGGARFVVRLPGDRRDPTTTPPARRHQRAGSAEDDRRTR